MNARESIAIERHRIPALKFLGQKFRAVFSWFFLTPCYDCPTIEPSIKGWRVMKTFRVDVYRKTELMACRLADAPSEQFIRRQLAEHGVSQGDVYVTEIKVK